MSSLSCCPPGLAALDLCHAGPALPCLLRSLPPPPRCPPADVHTMVLATELAGIAGAAYTGWQVLGAWLRYVRQMGVRFDDVSLLEAVDIFFAGLITKGEDAGGRKEGWGGGRHMVQPHARD